ncbi:hypothetical protein L596_029537 [Steinernema carpocapsae]|uniref:Dipeptidylpeptidase IV N-terminal domain-containing protein n=1 Tax=Steinernema carpocapsae TaxID=34508 RepID=A0A4U5LUX9_STECR|nr:hypothetical protein L596_029537 [Steinernema carpocapsae]
MSRIVRIVNTLKPHFFSIYRTDRHGNIRRRLATRSTHPAISPDSSTVIYNYKNQIYSMKTKNGKNKTQLTMFPLYGSKRDLHFGPQGHHIYFTQEKSGQKVCYKMNSNGTNLESLGICKHHWKGIKDVIPTKSKVLYVSPEGDQVVYTDSMREGIFVYQEGPDAHFYEHRVERPTLKPFPGEKHFENIRQLTFGGQNAEGYFSFDDQSIVLQAAGSSRYGTTCDQIYRLELNPTPTPSTPLSRLSTGLGACTCAYFHPDGETTIHASTFLSATFDKHTGNSCPPKKCQSKEAQTDNVLKKLCNTSYVWDLFPDYDIFKVNKYGNIIAQLTDAPGYDAEGAVSPDGRRIVFTSLRSGDPELWIMDFDGNNKRQLTHSLGYDGGPFFSPDGTKIGFRASRPSTVEEIDKYKLLLNYNLVEPLAMELFTINVDGTGMRQITKLGRSNWAPFYLSDNRRIIFSSNFNATSFGAFDLYVINEDGTGLERVTYNEKGFDAFPMMSHRGDKLIWGSSRNGRDPTELNLFLADWVN